MAINNILVPVDFSENSKNGLNVACDIAKRFNAQIHLVNAFHVPSPAVDIVGAPPAYGSLINDFQIEVEESMQKLKTEVPALNQVSHNEEVYLAHTIDAIYSAVEANDIDLIVMGTKKSHSGLEHLLGGISTDVIRFAECPVLVIPEQATSFDLKHIALAVDYKDFDHIDRLETLVELAWEYNATLRIIHVTEDETHTSENPFEMVELADKFADLDFEFETLHGKNVKERLVNYIDDNHVNLLVMMPRNHGLFERIFEGSLTKKVALDAHIPLMTIHE